MRDEEDPMSYDVVVVGSGIAGLSAALAVAEMGGRPLLLEKAERLGGVSAYSWGILWVPGNHLAAAAGVVDSLDEARSYLRYIGAGFESPERQEALLTQSARALRFYEEAGLAFRLVGGLTDHYYDYAPGSRDFGRSVEAAPVAGHTLGPWQERVAVPLMAPFRLRAEELISWGGMNSRADFDAELMQARESDDLRGLGAGLVAAFVAELASRGVDMRTSARATSLLRDGDRVVGVVLVDGSSISATRGVVLAAGGYDGDPDLARRYDGFPRQVPMGTTAATGDALRMAAEQGASLGQIHNNLQTFLGLEFPRDDDADLATTTWWGAFHSELASPHTMVVNRQGHRFGNEAHFQYLAPKLREFEPRARAYVNLPAYLVFDSQYTSRFGFAGSPAGAELPPMVTRADSLAELADALGVDVPGLQATVSRFNGFARDREDADFGRGSELWRLSGSAPTANPRLGTLEKPPYYGVELRPTCGPSVGIAADENARVLDVRGRTIPGLYATGSAACFDDIGVGYQAGLTLMSGLTFSYLAARDALGAGADRQT